MILQSEMSTPEVTVIIPTTAQASRQAEIVRCVESIRASSRQPVHILAVVNGKRHDKTVCDWLKAQPDIQFFYLETGSLPLAILEGRKQVRTMYFSFLDDDDEYLPGATDLKLAAIKESEEIDVVVTNTYRRERNEDSIVYSHLAEVPLNPLSTLFEANWLQSGNALFRAASVEIEYFANYQQFMEWTWLAFQLALGAKKIAALQVPTARVHVTPGSLSQSTAYFDSAIVLYEKMLNCNIPSDIRKIIKSRIGAAWHCISERALNQGEWRRAIACHFRSMRQPGGWRYLSYSRHLLLNRNLALVSK